MKFGPNWRSRQKPAPAVRTGRRRRSSSNAYLVGQQEPALPIVQGIPVGIPNPPPLNQMPHHQRSCDDVTCGGGGGGGNGGGGRRSSSFGKISAPVSVPPANNGGAVMCSKQATVPQPAKPRDGRIIDNVELVPSGGDGEQNKTEATKYVVPGARGVGFYQGQWYACQAYRVNAGPPPTVDVVWDEDSSHTPALAMNHVMFPTYCT